IVSPTEVNLQKNNLENASQEAEGRRYFKNSSQEIESFDPTVVRFVEAPPPPGVAATQSPWKDAADDPRPVVLATTNKAFLDFTANWLESIRRIATRPKILIVAEDRETQRFLYGRPGVHVVVSRGFDTPAEQLPWDSPIYNAMVNKRPAYIYQLLQRGHDVLFSDVDTVWLNDPFPYFQGDFHVAVEEDQHKPYVAYCAGFVFFRAAEKTREFVREWLRRLHRSKTKISDQVLMNEMLTKNQIPGLRTMVLPSEIFPNGKLFFMTPGWRQLHRQSAAVVHNNWIQSKEKKLQRFKDHGLWFIDAEKP
ncbi:UDP-D-xylose:L-fucose alpha-1,3-D-xylosyltransferase 3-like, partial [Acanthaster planci]|uniref:UDP-D-xylose:L-fucose alpha-1,3-D-xylosyltransferase 3-like n=1 Tax=Acanthaster planci TaxID=133434 RepID=A0A8B7XWF4_ACAPL